jgi:predicted Rossmann-fold nucleotide-binding protein
MHTDPALANMRSDEPSPKFVLVTGTGRTISNALARVARMVGTTLAEDGFGLVTGNSTGVDKWVAEAFCAEVEHRHQSLTGTFCQVALEGGTRFFRRGGLPLPGFKAPGSCKIKVGSIDQWQREALYRSHAAVMLAGGRGTLQIARRCIERGQPVFPLPFTGGNSDGVFQEILKTWESHPVPGLSRTQFLRLAEPWVTGTGALSDLLRGTLAEFPDIFISYRRSDAATAAGRIADDLAEYFGHRRVFFDIQGIAPSKVWNQSIHDALDRCKAGVVVIGRDWLVASAGSQSRIHDSNDIVRSEIQHLLTARKVVFPVLVEGASLPETSQLPESLHLLRRHQTISLDNGGWAGSMKRLIGELEIALRRPQPLATASATAAPVQ